jgi:hypothetical protein
MKTFVVLKTNPDALPHVIANWEGLCKDGPIQERDSLEIPISQGFKRSSPSPRIEFGDIKIKIVRFKGHPRALLLKLLPAR